ncbi:MAG: ATP-dependent helicase [Jiangellaceae bacterium]|nr:ATP-dependent helicase [Jiangellaceae bacterium]
MAVFFGQTLLAPARWPGCCSPSHHDRSRYGPRCSGRSAGRRRRGSHDKRTVGRASSGVGHGRGPRSVCCFAEAAVLVRWPTLVSVAGRVGFVLIPFVTVALSVWLNDEPITAGLVIGGVLVLAGVYVGALRRRLSFARYPRIRRSNCRISTRSWRAELREARAVGAACWDGGVPTTRGESVTALRLVRTERAEVDAPVLDSEQRRVVEHRGGPLLVLAGPGTGKTTTLVESVVDRVERDGIDPEDALVLTFSRRAAAELRERIARRLRRTVREPSARTFHSYAFGLLRREAQSRGDPPPRLITAAEQDLLIRDLLRGEVEEFGAGDWPQRLRPALPTRGFAHELRDLVLRMTERRVSPRQLAVLGGRHGRDDWVAAARFAQQYAAVTALRHPPAYDPAGLVRAAAVALRHDAGLLAHERDTRAVVLVDEYQDADPAQQELLQLVAGGGRDLVVVGDPDQSIYAFRGAEAEGLRDFPDRFRTAASEPAPVVALGTSRRLGSAVLAATRRIATRLGGPPRHRELRPSDDGPPGEVAVHLLPSASAEAAFIAGRLRRAHLVDGVPWQSMAVLVRSAVALPVLRRGLTAAGVPVAVRLEEVPLVHQPPVRALLDVLALATGQRPLDADLAVDLLSGPLGGTDPLALRRLRQALRKLEVATGGSRTSAELLVAAIQQPAIVAPVGEHAAAPLTRLADALRAARDAAEKPGATAEEVLWSAWNATGLASRWSQAALRDGPAGAAADRDLDAVVALFDAAARFTDRLPGENPAGFLDQLRGLEIPADTLAPRAQPSTAVQLMTAHAAKGLEWDLVVVAAVQEGSWPDLRARGGLLGIETLLDVVAGCDDPPAIRHSARLADECRLFFVAATRARRRLIVTAVAAEDAQPSRFLDYLDPVVGNAADRPVERPLRNLDLLSVVAELRRVVCDPAQPYPRRQGAAHQLARLAAAGVRSADPQQWYGLRPISDDAPLASDGEPIHVSPSRVAEFDRCELRWLLTECGASSTETTSAGVGLLVHSLAENAARNGWSTDDLLAELDRRWPELGVGSGWVGRREYARTRPIVQRLGSWLAENPRTVLAVEQPFDVQIGRVGISGQVDRLERDAQGRLVVVDFKTGTSLVSPEELAGHPQLAAYQLAVEHGGFDAVTGGTRRSGGASLVQLRAAVAGVKEQTQRPLGDSADPGWAVKLLQRTADRMAGSTFRAIRSRWCNVCPALPSCPAHPDGGQVTP